MADKVKVIVCNNGLMPRIYSRGTLINSSISR